MRAPAAASRPQWGPWAAGPPPQSWAAPLRSSLPLQLAGRAAGTAPAHVECHSSDCLLHRHKPHAGHWTQTKNWLAVWPAVFQAPGTTRRELHRGPPHGAHLQHTGGGAEAVRVCITAPHARAVTAVLHCALSNIVGQADAAYHVPWAAGMSSPCTHHHQQQRQGYPQKC